MRINWGIIGGLLLLISFSGKAQNLYWIAASSGNWSNPANWSTSSGGSAGSSIPTSSTDVVFDANGLGKCLLDLSSVSIASLSMNGYTDTLDLQNRALSVGGTTYLRTGTIHNSGNASLIVSTASATATFQGTTISTPLQVSAARIYLNGSDFQRVCNLEQTGNGSGVYCQGGNIFHDSVLFNSSGIAGSVWAHAVNAADTFKTIVEYFNTGDDRIHAGYGANATFFEGDVFLNSVSGTGIYIGNTNGQAAIASTANLRMGPAGFSSGILYIRGTSFRNSAALQLTLTGSAYARFGYCSFAGNMQLSSPRIYSDYSRFQGNVEFTKTGASDDYSTGGNYFAGNLSMSTSSAGLIFATNQPDSCMGNVIMNNTGTRHLVYGYNADSNYIGGNLNINQQSGLYSSLSHGGNSSIVIDGNLNLQNSSATGSIYFAHGLGSQVQINGNISLENSSTGYISFGQGGGYTTLDSNRTLSIGGAGFTNGQLNLRNFYQPGSTCHVLKYGYRLNIVFKQLICIPNLVF